MGQTKTLLFARIFTSEILEIYVTGSIDLYDKQKAVSYHKAGATRDHENKAGKLTHPAN